MHHAPMKHPSTNMKVHLSTPFIHLNPQPQDITSYEKEIKFNTWAIEMRKITTVRGKESPKLFIFLCEGALLAVATASMINDV